MRARVRLVLVPYIGTPSPVVQVNVQAVRRAFD